MYNKTEGELIIYTYKFPLYPTKRQAKIIDGQLETLRNLYNKTLETKINAYKNDGRNLTLFDLHKKMTEWKSNGEFSGVYAQVMQECQSRVDAAYSRFFAKQNRFPRFKGKERLRSLTYKQNGFSINANRIKLSKIGNILFKKITEIQGTIKTVSVVRHPTQKYFICITTEHINKLDCKLSGLQVGIDLGLKKLLTISDGTTIERPRLIERSEKDIARLNRRFQKNKTNKNLRSLNKAYEKLSNRRKDFVEKLSLDLVRKYDLIVFEDINTNQLKEKAFRPVNRAICDASWRMLIEKTKYKAESAGKKVILVNPANTSKTCSRCGKLHELSLSDRELSCSCGLIIDRDLNASYNILRVGLHSLDESPKMLPEKG